MRGSITVKLEQCLARRRILLLLVACALIVAGTIRYWAKVRTLAAPMWIEITRDLPYGPHSQNRLDILKPRWRTPSAAVILFHGGGWVHGDRNEMFDRACRRFLTNGLLVLNVDYRLGSIESAVDDALQALRWVVTNASRLRVDRSRIVLAGESAGAHLALLAAFQSDERVAAVINLYGPTDLTLLANRPAVRAVLAPYSVDIARRLSPISFIRSGLPPVLTIHGTADRTVPPEHATTLERSLREAGQHVSTIYIPDAGHGFSAHEQELAYAAIFQFLRGLGLAR